MTKGLELYAVCDIDEKKTSEASSDHPGIQTFTDLDDLLEEDFDMVTVAVPHNLHAPVALKCIAAGKHTILEKPMCITVAEATSMIEAAKKSRVMLSVFHNRRWDGDFKALKEVIDRGFIGKVYQIEAYLGGYGHPGTWWRAYKDISGGALYDWGAHFIDWLLNLVPEKMTGVMGVSQKLVWKDVTNEDDVRAIIRFESGATADFQQSYIAMAGKPRLRILGTKGAILDGDKHFDVTTLFRGYRAQLKVPFKEDTWHDYYKNVNDHLSSNRELVVKPEEGRRVIAVMETAEKSWNNGSTMEKVPYE
jgi:predicted dehydrogenase